jgi:transcriptional regulator with XRE-family HTH domain
MANKANGRANGKSNGHSAVQHTPDFDWKEPGDRIRRWRVACGMNQQQLAEASGMTQSGLHRIETGQTNPQLSTLQRIASALHCSVRELLCGKCDSDSCSAAVVQRVKRVVESEDEAARQILESALNGAELLLERSRHNRFLNGGGCIPESRKRRQPPPVA